MNAPTFKIRSCVMCKQSKPASEFHASRTGQFSYCRECRCAYDRRYYAERGKAARLARCRAHNMAARLWMIELKAGIPCTDCGQLFPAWVMQWDHLPGKAKVKEIGNMVRSHRREAILDEVAKCELVCANCHAVRTRHRAIARQRGDTSIAEDQLPYRVA